MLCDDDTDRVCVRERLPFISPLFFLGEKKPSRNGKRKRKRSGGFSPSFVVVGGGESANASSSSSSSVGGSVAEGGGGRERRAKEEDDGAEKTRQIFRVRRRKRVGVGFDHRSRDLQTKI